MNDTRITVIDITKQARALACIRLTDSVLVVVCGSMAIAMLSDLLIHWPSGVALLFQLLVALFLCFAAYTGWRHVGVIDPAVWKTHLIVLPILGALSLLACLVIAVSLLANSDSAAGLLDREETFGMYVSAWIGGISLLGWISLMRLRKMNITAKGATIDQVLFRLAKDSGVCAVQATDIRRINKPRGLVFGTAGAVILLASTLAPILEKIPAREKFRISQQIDLLGFYLVVRARRYFQVDADSLLAADRRPPILFLRSFDDDERQRYAGSDKAWLDFSLETRLSNHFSRFGPFVAIGSPKETVPQLGAARVLLSNDEWQPRVLGWMQDAKLIIMYSGKTHWVNWELQKVLESKCATRLILLIPEIKALRSSKRNEDIFARVEHVREVFKSTPWEEELLQFDDFVGLRAMLFRPHGSVVMIKSRSRSRDSYHLAAMVAHEILLDSAREGNLVARPDWDANQHRLSPRQGPEKMIVKSSTKSVRLHCVSGEFSGEELEVQGAGIIIGRDPHQANLVLSSPVVSAAHVRLWPDKTGRGLMVEDLTSTNGTYFVESSRSGEKPHWVELRGSKLLVSGAKFRLGDDAAVFEII